MMGGVQGVKMEIPKDGNCMSYLTELLPILSKSSSKPSPPSSEKCSISCISQEILTTNYITQLLPPAVSSDNNSCIPSGK